MAEVTITKLKCERCGHTWVPRKPEITICPKCKSPYWNKPRQVKEVRKGLLQGSDIATEQSQDGYKGVRK